MSSSDSESHAPESGAAEAAAGTVPPAGSPPGDEQKKEKIKEDEKKKKKEDEKAKGFAAFVAAWCALQGLKMPDLHERIANWLEKKWRAERKAKRLLLLAFRGAGKSTLVGLFAAWLLVQKRDLRILTLSADLALARKMVGYVKRLIERHPGTHGLKPKNPELWGAEQFTVERPALLRDPSMLARGVDGNFTGSRADLVICDDVEVPGNSDTPAKRAALRQKLGEIEFVLVPDGAQLYLGTPHTYYSIYAATPREGETRPFLDGFERKSVPVLQRGRAAWADKFPKRDMDKRRNAAPRKFASQMMLEPVAPEACRFDPAKLLRYGGEVEYRETHGRGSLWLEGRKLASLRVWWDPAYGRSERASRNVIAAVYQGEDGHYWLHRVHYFGFDAALADSKPAEHAEADQLCREAARFARELGAPAITVEDNGVGKFIPGLLRKALETAVPGVGVIASHTRAPKDERILGAFDITLAAGLLHAHASVLEGPFVEELREWQPEGKSGQADDGLDAAAGAILAEPTRLGPFPRAPGAGDWRTAGQVHKAVIEFDV